MIDIALHDNLIGAYALAQAIRLALTDVRDAYDLKPSSQELLAVPQDKLRVLAAALEDVMHELITAGHIPPPGHKALQEVHLNLLMDLSDQQALLPVKRLLLQDIMAIGNS